MEAAAKGFLIVLVIFGVMTFLGMLLGCGKKDPSPRTPEPIIWYEGRYTCRKVGNFTHCYDPYWKVWVTR